MSLFHCSEWYNTIISGSRCMIVANLINNYEQLIVGSLEGTITIIDPGGNIEQRYETAIIVEQMLDQPVLQIIVGKFINSYDETLIVVLHPKSLVYFQNEESFTLEKVFEHRLQSDHAYNMCCGNFGRNDIKQICVQSLSCNLSVFEGENCVLMYHLPDIIHPGPIAYTSTSDCLLFSSGSVLQSIRYSVITLNSSLNNCSSVTIGKSSLPIGKQITKKINIEWSLNLGDTPLEIYSVDTLLIQPSIMILCKRSVFCVTNGGVIRYIIRLQCVATCMMINLSTQHSNQDEARIPICVGVSTNTLLFFKHTKMVWTAQLTFTPIYVNVCSFSESFCCLLSLLSDDYRIFVGYLGTEPSLFRMPVTDTRYIDLEARKKQLREYEKIILKCKNENENDFENGLQIKSEVNMDQKSLAYDVDEDVPSATAVLFISGIKDKVDIVFEGDIFANQTNFSLTSNGNVAITMFCKNEPVFNLCCQIVAISTVEVITEELILPLQLICYETPVQKLTLYKISLDCSHSFAVSQLFPEFSQENHTSISLRPYFSKNIVSLFLSSKTNRYRIQSNATDFLYVVFSELIRRLRTQQSDIQFRCPLPLQMLLNNITTHLETENEAELLEHKISQLAIQLRHSETILLSKLKSDHEPFTSHVSTLINYTYQELMLSLDKFSQLEIQLNGNRRTSLKSLLNLMHCILSSTISVNLPFNGEILNGTNQKLSNLLVQLIDSNNSILDNDSNTTNEDENIFKTKSINAEIVKEIIINYCEKNTTKENEYDWSSGIGKIPEEEEKEESEILNNEKEEKIIDEAINQAYNEFLEIKSGSLPSKLAK